MGKRCVVLLAVMLLGAGHVCLADTAQVTSAVKDVRLAMLAQEPAASAAPAATTTPAEGAAEPEAAAKKGPPLPLHCIEGYSGGAITPMAYLCNPGAKGTAVSLPSAAYTFINLGSKELHTVTVTETFFGRIELGYAANWLNLGTLPRDIRAATGVDIRRDTVALHHFNVRGMLVEENSFDMPLPAITGGVHFKYNEDIGSINNRLGGALDGIGYDQSHGVDFTITASKMFPELCFGRPVILTAGTRASRAAQLGYLGFGDDYKWTVEGSVACLPADQLLLAYEFRMKNNPYRELQDLIDREQNWHAFSASYIVNDRLTLSGLFCVLGNVANARADCSLGLQVKYEF